MSRAPRSIPKRNRHKKWIKRAKGYRGRRSTIFKLAKEAVLKAGRYAFHDRRKKKTVFRSAWQVTINAGVRPLGLTYSKFIHALRTHKVELDRQVLAELAHKQPEIFTKVVEQVKK
ncbi:MAG: 50S ribosomal protein L20 [Candidatus Andersenbacteria bacterium RIFCSPHIGHO2_12_FULL_45_11b]|uniref:Large ribosomal subunit protein bL20 n=1 Tax=Candidatus Andersenbacteria bacterium RIFCSPHIGHO2_12_FULL_45_11b TaxID=1797282 RepID=A0A1G1X9W4_9BACT|nr:MAG: 50S ribosomal protein L20 [Candidatus Andersenbacteria bacterium RIFCSPHIGHO2_12_FULL_45_11b]